MPNPLSALKDNIDDRIEKAGDRMQTRLLRRLIRDHLATVIEINADQKDTDNIYLPMLALMKKKD